MQRGLEKLLVPRVGRGGRLMTRLLHDGRSTDPAADFQPSATEARLAAWRQRWAPLPPHRDFDTLFPPTPEADVAGGTSRGGGWEVHDEGWDQVQRRFEYRRLLQQGRSFSLPAQASAQATDPNPLDGAIRWGPGGAIHVDRPPPGQQNWVWLHLPPRRHVWRDYRWRLTVTRHTEFRELQLAMRYVDFFNRYRFRYEDGAWHFDIVSRGRFENSRLRTPFEMKPGRDYALQIIVRGNRFVLIVDGRTLLDAVDPIDRFGYGPVAVIFWEDDGQTPIRADVTQQTITETRV